jgi:hypothetical protein
MRRVEEQGIGLHSIFPAYAQVDHMSPRCDLEHNLHGLKWGEAEAPPRFHILLMEIRPASPEAESAASRRPRLRARP